MQIFSELQRNSTFKTFIKIILIFFINSFSALLPFFPILIGFFLFCDELILGIVYIGFFSIIHNVNIFYLLFIYLFLKFFLVNKIIDYINPEYQDVMFVLIVYFFLFIYFVQSVNIYILLMYLLFNYSFDILLIKVFKCEAKSL
jgi:hypothetical protein